MRSSPRSRRRRVHKRVGVSDAEGLLDSAHRHGGRFLVRGGKHEVVEGTVRSRSVVIEFPSYAAALACYRSPGYQAAAAHRKGRAEFDLIVAEGTDGAQF